MTTRKEVYYDRHGKPVTYIIPTCETDEERRENEKKVNQMLDSLYRIELEIAANNSP